MGLGAVPYNACRIIWIFGVILGYELIHTFCRRCRFRVFCFHTVLENPDVLFLFFHSGRPLILPIYLPILAFNLVSVTSNTHFCFPRVNLCAVLQSAEGSLRDLLAEMC
jgi:hypothetical protein